MDSLRKSNSNTIKENGDLNAKLKEKESLIQSLEEALEPESCDEVEEVVIMNKNTSGHKCTACNKKYSTNTDLENHMDDMHGEIECVFCSEIFPNNQTVTKSTEGTRYRPNQTSSRGAGGRGPCRYGDNCFRKETCGYSHGNSYEQGFPPITRKNQQKRRN